MGDFQKLKVWQEAKELAVNVYKLTRENEFSKEFGLKDQIQRAAISIASNIAEGDESGTDKQSIRFFYISRGSAAELITQIIIAGEIGLVQESRKIELLDACKKITAMLTGLIKARNH